MIEIVSYGPGARAGQPAPKVLAAPPLESVRPLPRPLPGAPPAPSPRPLPEAPGRLDWVDVAKGICIVLVVMMHATLGIEAEMGRPGFMHAVVAFAKPFRMPDFFLVSGLFLSRVIDRDWRSFADKRVVHFAYFYLLWLVIQSAFKFGQVGDGTLAGFGRHLAQGLVGPYSTLWFIYLLAVFSVVTKLLRGVPPVIVLAAAAALQILPVMTGSTLIDEFCERWVYFLAGYLFASRILALAGTAERRPIWTLAGLAAWALANAAVALTPVDFARRTVIADLPVISLAAGIAGALAIVCLAALLARLRIAAPLRYAGQNSIVIYLTFFLPMALTREAIIRTGLIADPGIGALVVLAVALLVPLAIERQVRHTRWSFLYRRPGWAHIPPAGSKMRLQPAE